ncbi:papain-like cysteine protease family protein [Methylobacterium sp. 22177]|uniref:papain-like cysteine protease family protein n=1 Tax=Methylobacterium sp. 22177 TaxID=3453885 RepID=UPI003F84074D
MMLHRRQLIGAAASTLVSLKSRSASALQTCSSAGLPPGGCSALIDPTRFNGVPSQQEQSQWCWAACISMICRWYGYHMAQSRIVNEMYGGVVNMPAADELLTSALNHDWTADDGRKFKISADTFSPSLGTASVSNERVIEDLTHDRPLLNGSRTHATVVARVDYLSRPGQPPQVMRVHVIDPWPGAAPGPQMARFLENDEMTPLQSGGSLRYLASIKISPT